MKGELLLAAGLTMVICGCATMQGQSGEVKVTIEQTPLAVQKTIRSELVGARLEDIAKKQRQGETVYETDIIKNGHKWEIVIGEDGQIISNLQGGSAGKQQADKMESGAAQEAGWRKTFEVRKSDLAPVGNNPWLTIQPGRVLEPSKASTLSL